MIESGTKVKVHYKGTLDDGTVFDSSENRDPLEFQLGSGQVIAGFDAAVKDMEVGTTKTVTIPSDKAYGERREGLVLTLANDQFSDGKLPNVGQSLRLTTPHGPLIARVTDINDDGVVVGYSWFSAVVWSSPEANMVRLDKYLKNNSSLDSLSSARAVSESGEIVGSGWSNDTSSKAAFLAIPK